MAKLLYEDPLKFSRSWNFGPNTQEVLNVGDVANQIVRIYGKGSVSPDPVSSDFHEANLLQLNCDLAHQLMGWYPRWDVYKTLDVTTKWYKQVDEGIPMKEVTKSQIEDYFGNKL